MDRLSQGARSGRPGLPDMPTVYAPSVDEAVFGYDLALMPPGRVPFRRWRFELWHGGNLLVTGWRTSPRHAERALRTAAAQLAHRRLGLHLLRSEAAEAEPELRPGATSRIRCGAVSCLLVPRGIAAA
jgi:hypothetical protein